MKKAKHKLLSLTALLTLVLVGCQNNSEQATATSQSQESVSSKASSSKEEAETKESSKEEDQKEEASNMEEIQKEEESKTESKAENTESQSSANQSSVPTIAGDLGRTSSHQGLDIDQIQQGDLSTLVGTWRNAKGQEFVFHEDGSVDPDSHLNLNNFKREGQVLLADLRSNGVGGAALYIAPAGVEIVTPIASIVDASDQSRDRLVGGHTYDAVGVPEEFYYRVD
ncbi:MULTISPECIES: DUF6287 domain-containing protein [Aerococcus]|uniref:DUF6287 domain-containing protein n=1 Tax=Aerococcus TaxID=1375 RepID=UPI000DCD2196|nr:DUF6287 domain-containing protein [Aerococcus urinae]RAV94331.1 hypothetical protein DBT53_05855 [Aerococcus mictus]MDK6375318.1 DUF6287 domain-containing protein [Aerococcus urinae]MDK6420166.1 DUF6287 domain-containing protein [Aerococcus urinae]MDK8075659.1 DUF6287 domain-containing protein [Aerococcus urinae]MDK8084572.1 DUF6287 domain-containing protein [Aerococcus urinae]